MKSIFVRRVMISMWTVHCNRIQNIFFISKLLCSPNKGWKYSKLFARLENHQQFIIHKTRPNFFCAQSPATDTKKLNTTQHPGVPFNQFVWQSLLSEAGSKTFDKLKLIIPMECKQLYSHRSVNDDPQLSSAEWATKRITNTN